MTDREREALRRHDEWISQPVRIIFPRKFDGTRRRVLCRGCGEEITQPAGGGKPLVWCTTKCKDKIWNATKREQRAAKAPRLSRGPGGGPSLL